MRIDAEHWDGYTCRLLYWKLEFDRGAALLEADWSGRLRFTRNRPLFRALFEIDEVAFRSKLHLLDGMAEEYTANCTDLVHRRLSVQDGDHTIRRHVYGAGLLRRKYSEINHFLTFWKLLEAPVMAQLPPEVQV